MRATDAISFPDHVMKGIDLEFCLAKDTTLPGEIHEAMDFMLSTPLSLQVDFWEGQLKRAKLVVGQAADLQQKWYRKVDPRIQSATGKFNFIDMMSLMAQFNLGGASWMQQCVWGFPITGGLSQTGVYPTDPEVTHAPDFSTIWQESKLRYQTREKDSGRSHADHLWKEATCQVQKGWLSTPSPLTPTDNAPSRP